MALDKSGKTLEEVIDKNGVRTRRWKGKKKAEANESTKKLQGVKASVSPRNAAEADAGHMAVSEPHIAGDGLSEEFQPFVDKDNIFMARDGKDFIGEMNVVIDDDEDPSEVAAGFAERYNLDNSTRLVPSEFEGEAVLQFRGNIKSVSNMIGEYADKPPSSVEDSMRTKYGVDDLDRDRFSVGQRRRARNAASQLADKLVELERAQKEYDDAYEKLAEFGEGTYLLKDGRTVSMEQRYRFSTNDFMERFPLNKHPEMYEMKPRKAGDLKNMMPEQVYAELRTPEKKLRPDIDYSGMKPRES